MNLAQLLVVWLVVDLGACAARIVWQAGDARNKDDR